MVSAFISYIMFFILPLLTLLGGHLASAAPAAGEVAELKLNKRDVCDGVGAVPELYKEYGFDNCKPVLEDAEDGSCPGAVSIIDQPLRYSY